MSDELNRVKNELNRVKNDLISREALKKAFDTWDKFGYTAQGELIRLTEETKDLYVPYVKYQDIVNCIDNAPTVEERPKGKWLIEGGNTLHYVCSECDCAGDVWDKFCKHCGAKMEVQE